MISSSIFNFINGVCYLHSPSIPSSGRVESLSFISNGEPIFNITLPLATYLEILPNLQGIKFNNFNPKELIDLVSDREVDSVYVKTQSNEFKEKLIVGKSLFKNLDFVFSLNSPHYAKPGKICAFTSVYNDNIFLDIWINYYKKIVGEENLYVIDHGSTISYDTSKANFIKIPRGQYDSNNLSLFNCYFQRFLLSQYKWVLHSDCDEILLVEGDNDFNKIINSYSTPSLLSTENAFEVLYDPRIQHSLDYSTSLLSQRTIMLPSPSFQKTYLTSAPVTWGPGFHKTYEKKLFDNRLWALHIKYIDPEVVISKNKNIWKNIDQSIEDAQIFFIKRDQSVYLYEEKNKIDGWINSVLPSTIAIPNWMKTFL